MGATGCRLRRLVSSPFSRSQLKALNRYSSSSNYSSGQNPRLFVDDPSTGSVVYRHALRTQRPSTIRWQNELKSSASFIGTVIFPLKTITTSGGILFVHTQLSVDPPSGSKRFVRVFLNMWRDMAELSIQHLKPNDYIYVSGYLQSFTKALDNGNVIMYPKLNVKEINFVANSNQRSVRTEDGESVLEKRRKRLYLWQVFFANPYEWLDLRKRKVNPSQPDFKHKCSVVKLFGLGHLIHHGSQDNSNCRILEWVTRVFTLQAHPASSYNYHCIVEV